MDGRKSIGGKLEMKVRVRHPFVSKQVEEVKERWLVIDNFERKLQPPVCFLLLLYMLLYLMCNVLF
jgi:coiled-coil and C2 domain-containing protein 1